MTQEPKLELLPNTKPSRRSSVVYALYAVAALVAVIVCVIIVGAMRPTDFQISRSQLIQASPEQLFPYINNLKRFQEWNPFKDKDPKATNEFSGPDDGPGAKFRWSGDSNAGEGIMTIVSNVPDSKVNVDLEFIRPFAGHNGVEFGLAPQASGTTVSWTMTGKYALVPRIVGLFINMDKMIGNDFDTGLNRLKNLAEVSR